MASDTLTIELKEGATLPPPAQYKPPAIPPYVPPTMPQAAVPATPTYQPPKMPAYQPPAIPAYAPPVPQQPPTWPQGMRSYQPPMPQQGQPLPQQGQPYAPPSWPQGMNPANSAQAMLEQEQAEAQKRAKQRQDWLDQSVKNIQGFAQVAAQMGQRLAGGVGQVAGGIGAAANAKDLAGTLGAAGGIASGVVAIVQEIKAMQERAAESIRSTVESIGTYVSRAARNDTKALGDAVEKNAKDWAKWIPGNVGNILGPGISEAIKQYRATNEGFLATAQGYAAYDGRTAEALALAEVRGLRGDIRRAGIMGEANAELVDANSRLEEATKNLYALWNGPAAKEQAKIQTLLAEKMEQMVANLERAIGIADKRDRNPFLDKIQDIADAGFLDRADRPFGPERQIPRNPLR